MSFKRIERPDDATLELIRRTASDDYNVAMSALQDFAKATAESIRQAILVGDIVSGIFDTKQYAPGQRIRFPIDLLAPGEEKQHVAYTVPSHGRIPNRQVEGDYIQIPTYAIASSIDWLLEFAEEADYDVVGRCIQVLEAGFIKKINDDGWHTVLSSGVDRNILVFDADATAGQFTKRLVSLMKVLMIRNGGGNTASLRRWKLTDLFLSHEAVEDIRNWGLDQVDEVSRREFMMMPDGTVPRIFGVNLNALDEFGENQEYQEYFTDALGATLASGDLELVVGLDLMNRGYIMPMEGSPRIFPDPTAHRSNLGSLYGRQKVGMANTDVRNTLLASL